MWMDTDSLSYSAADWQACACIRDLDTRCIQAYWYWMILFHPCTDILCSANLRHNARRALRNASSETNYQCHYMMYCCLCTGLLYTSTGIPKSSLVCILCVGVTSMRVLQRTAKLCSWHYDWAATSTPVSSADAPEPNRPARTPHPPRRPSSRDRWPEG